jgi:hypothetical protein
MAEVLFGPGEWLPNAFAMQEVPGARGLAPDSWQRKSASPHARAFPSRRARNVSRGFALALAESVNGPPCNHRLAARSEEGAPVLRTSLFACARSSRALLGSIPFTPALALWLDPVSLGQSDAAHSGGTQAAPDLGGSV